MKQTAKIIGTLILAAMLGLTLLTAYQKPKTAEWTVGKPLGKDKIKIGILYVDDAEDGWSYAHRLGLKEMQDKIGIADEQIISRLKVIDTNGSIAAGTIRELIYSGANVIIATSWGYMDACENLSREYPNVIFAHSSGHKNNDTNFTNYYGRDYQARYLSGIVAGLRTETDKIGYVAAMGRENSEVTSGLDAFAMGVESVNPEAKVYVRVTHNWYDPAAERESAQELIARDCDVIAQHVDTANPQIEAGKAGVWSLGYNCDMAAAAPGAVITSVVWNWGVYYSFLINSLIDGTFNTQPYLGDLPGGLVSLAPINDSLAAPNTARAVKAAKEQILSGELNIFAGLIETNDGARVGAPGAAMSGEEIIRNTHWYYRNIIELK
ncbi:MAG: BMP family ABC transporter substrate-binding protein [Candidatus Adiutrix sp.]|jgi:basic membrane protein A|nr:BMP family ABC transporter substrate-binding protein [Candidatus Adiutrix sp.]